MSSEITLCARRRGRLLLRSNTIEQETPDKSVNVETSVWDGGKYIRIEQCVDGKDSNSDLIILTREEFESIKKLG